MLNVNQFHSLKNHHQSFAISNSFVGIQTRMTILIPNSIYSVMTININQVFESRMNYVVFGTMCNLTMITVCKYHYCIKFITDFLNRKPNIIRQRIRICHIKVTVLRKVISNHWLFWLYCYYCTYFDSYFLTIWY